jgi:hypothetical protein
MEISKSKEAVCHFIEFKGDDSQYTRYGPDCWYIRMGESDEPVYDCEEHEKAFQEAFLCK